MKHKSIRYLTWGAIIAALYVLLTYLASLLGLASGVIQFRLSEALCIMACFTPAAIPGLYIGCLLSNILTGCVFWDILFGPIATLIGAVGTYLLRRNKYLAVIPPILANTLIVPFEICVWSRGYDSVSYADGRDWRGCDLRRARRAAAYAYKSV